MDEQRPESSLAPTHEEAGAAETGIDLVANGRDISIPSIGMVLSNPSFIIINRSQVQLQSESPMSIQEEVTILEEAPISAIDDLNAALSEFALFVGLPPELRLKIWGVVAQEQHSLRVLQKHRERTHIGLEPLRFSIVSQPGARHANREAYYEIMKSYTTLQFGLNTVVMNLDVDIFLFESLQVFYEFSAFAPSVRVEDVRFHMAITRNSYIDAYFAMAMVNGESRWTPMVEDKVESRRDRWISHLPGPRRFCSQGTIAVSKPDNIIFISPEKWARMWA